jgi:hypothetical protein
MLNKEDIDNVILSWDWRADRGSFGLFTVRTRAKIHSLFLSTASCSQTYGEAYPLFFTCREFWFVRGARNSLFHCWVNRQGYFTAKKLSAIRSVRLFAQDVLEESFESDIGQLRGLRRLTIMFMYGDPSKAVRAK